MLTAQRLRYLLHYDPETGIFVRRVAVGRHGRHKAGLIVGHQNAGDGYITIRVDGPLYLAQRLVWLYMTGEWPKHQIDHKNLTRNDNRWSNLREATHGQNVQNSSLRKNNTSGFKGASIIKTQYTLARPFRARITVNSKEIGLGYFATAAEAHEAYLKAADKYYGEFRRAK